MGMIQIRGADVCCCFNKRFAAQGQENRFLFCLVVLPMRRIQRCNHATCLRIMRWNFNRKVSWRSYLHWPESRHIRWGLAKLQSAWTSVLALPTLLVMQRVDWAQSLDTDPPPPPPPPWTLIRPDVLLSSCDSILKRALPSDCTWADSCNSKASFRIGIDLLPFLPLGGSDSPERLLWTGSLQRAMEKIQFSDTNGGGRNVYNKRRNASYWFQKVLKEFQGRDCG